jgi:cellulose synthase/poly-beta-1,6-N-acetylglucosamine synthase-like glycosyltransferase
VFPVAVALVLTSLLYLGLVLAASRRPVSVPAEGVDDLLYVIVVPCLDEEIVIGDTLAALSALPEDRVRIIVVDDDSADATSSIAKRFAPRVELLQRRRPRAQIGKGDSLNQAYQHVLATADRPLDRIVFGVVDADGRIDQRAIHVGDRYFSESDVGGLQFAISIRNRVSNLLARMQDFEFLGFAPVLLTAREHFGSVPLGGCGQFVRLSELTKLGPAPWTDSLTEDLDLGVRLLLEGSRVRFTALATVEQQGLTEIRPLVRQRTRWVQGHFQAWSLIPAVWRSSVPNRTFGDLVYMLLSPGFMLLSSVVFAVAPFLLAWTLASGTVAWTDPAVRMFLATVYLLMFGPALVYGLSYARHREDVGLLKALGISHLMPLYTYVWYAAAWRAVTRIVLRRKSWAKTARLVEGDTTRHHTPRHARGVAA